MKNAADEFYVIKKKERKKERDLERVSRTNGHERSE